MPRLLSAPLALVIFSALAAPRPATAQGPQRPAVGPDPRYVDVYAAFIRDTRHPPELATFVRDTELSLCGSARRLGPIDPRYA